jgi:hypothetical protein
MAVRVGPGDLRTGTPSYKDGESGEADWRIVDGRTCFNARFGTVRQKGRSIAAGQAPDGHEDEEFSSFHGGTALATDHTVESDSRRRTGMGALNHG